MPSRFFDTGNMGLYKFPFTYRRDKYGRCSAKAEDMWTGALEWAKHHGYNYVSSYGIEGVAPT